MSDARHFSAEQAINPYYFDSSTDTEIAQAEHNSIRNALRSAGVNVITTPAPADSQDGVYTANWALVRGDIAVLARLPNVRKSEEAYARRILEGLGKTVVEVPGDLRFSGQGDALMCGSYLFCGKGYRSDEAAQDFAARTLGLTRIQLQTVPQLDDNGTPVVNAISGWEDSFFYDIDLALSILKHPEQDPATGSITPGLVAYCPEAFTPESIATLRAMTDIELIEVSLEEAEQAFACNLVSTGSIVIMGDSAPHLKAAIESHGLKTITPHIKELSKGGGYIRCTTLTLD